MVSRETFIKQIKEMLRTYHKQYADRESANRFFLHDKSHMVKGYTESRGSNQQQVMHNGKELYNSDFQKLTDALLMKIMTRTVDYQKLILKKRKWILRVYDTRVPNNPIYTDYPYSYWERPTREKAEELAKSMKDLSFVKGIDLMKETMVDQYIMTNRRDYELIDNLMKKRN